MKINHQTKLNAVIGYPLTHTQSPILHNTIYQLLDINAVLLAQPHDNLQTLIHAIKTFSVGLTAVTMPFKEKVLKYLDETSASVKAIGACNTIIQKNNQLFGYNTDFDGIAFALRKIPISGKKVLVLGAGGAARAVGYFLQQHKADIFWMNRTQQKAHILAKAFGGKVIEQTEIPQISFDIIINTTPLGMHPNITTTPLNHYLFKSNQVVFDLVYNPVMTTLLKQAKKKQATIISGLDMFVGQALKQIELFSGKQPSSPVISKIIRSMRT